MKPPCTLSPKIITLVSDISRLLGGIEAVSFQAPGPKLRKKNQIRTVKATLAIEGHSFTEEQITAVLENKKVIGSQKELLEVQNAIDLYESLDDFRPDLLKSFLQAHGKLMNGLVATSGKLRTKNVGILKGTKVSHVAPGPGMLPELMGQLFSWIKTEKELHFLIKSCILHYEIEFIHPFEDGNGRIGRFWQTLYLTKQYAIFRYVPMESLIEKKQQAYYAALEQSDRAGDSRVFVEFMLEIIRDALEEFSKEVIGVTAMPMDRLMNASEYFNGKAFSRKDYMEFFKNISSATASRDLKEGVISKLLVQEGARNQSFYRFK